MSQSDAANAYLAYVENLPYDRQDGKLVRLYEERKRLTNINPRVEDDMGKDIHGLWIGALRGACGPITASEKQAAIAALAKQGKKPGPLTRFERPTREVVVHNAYLLFPSNILTTVRDMIDGHLDCSNVKLKIITNSEESTDLGVVNAFAKHSLRVLMDYYTQKRDQTKGVEISYYEYEENCAGKEASLHTKVLLANEDLFIGSSNADVRSYVMDSNNGIFIRNAPSLTNAYHGFTKQLTQGGRCVKDNMAYMTKKTHEQMLVDDRNGLLALFKKYDKKGRIKGELKDRILSTWEGLLKASYNHSHKIIYDNSPGAAWDYNHLFQGI